MKYCVTMLEICKDCGATQSYSFMTDYFDFQTDLSIEAERFDDRLMDKGWDIINENEAYCPECTNKRKSK